MNRASCKTLLWIRLRYANVTFGGGTATWQ
jgi:hypothetical protein